jgi:hypothetical protein
VGRTTRTFTSSKLGAGKEGFHAIDLFDERINPDGVSLEPEDKDHSALRKGMLG